MADYWIKLYIEILNDSKMAILPDRLWRRVIELFLAAGIYRHNGQLPDTQQLAWLLRTNTDDLELDLKQIALTGIIQRNGDGWLVTKFAERQAPVGDAERQRQHRDKLKKQQYYGDVTDVSRNVRQNRIITESESESDTTTLLAAFVNASQIPDYNTDAAEIVEVMSKAGVTPEDITEAVHILQSKKFTITGIKSIQKTAINVAKQRLISGNGYRSASEEY